MEPDYAPTLSLKEVLASALDRFDRARQRWLSSPKSAELAVELAPLQKDLDDTGFTIEHLFDTDDFLRLVVDDLANHTVQAALGIAARSAENMVAQDMIAKTRQLGPFKQRLQLEIFRTLVDLDSAADRCADLASTAMAKETEGALRQFLEMAARCYVMGFDGECAIICRAALERALKDRYIKEKLESELLLVDLIRGAALRGWLSRDQERMARDVQHRGNRTIHRQPDGTRDVLGTIASTAHVIEVLDYRF